MILTARIVYEDDLSVQRPGSRPISRSLPRWEASVALSGTWPMEASDHPRLHMRCFEATQLSENNLKISQQDVYKVY